MLKRVSQADLDQLCRVVNTRLGVPLEPWERDSGGRFRANIGSCYIAGSLGGVALEQIVGESGGVRVLLSASTKGELAGLMRAYLLGLESCEKNHE
jgi:hypothetical protein